MENKNYCVEKNDILNSQNGNDCSTTINKIQKLCIKGSKNCLPSIVWNKKVANTELEKFRKKIEAKFHKQFHSYWDFHKWTVENFSNFWEEAWSHLGMIASEKHCTIYKRMGPNIIDCEWFGGCRFNYAENILRIRDDRVALICANEVGETEEVTYAQMFEQVQLYTAAFRNNGLRKGDRVACFMSNRKEAIFAFLATVSIGGIFGGTQPFIGKQQAANVFSKMEAKFLIIIDHHIVYGHSNYNADYVPYIVEHSPTLEKVIIVVTKPETKSKIFSSNSVFLDDFLLTGMTADGQVPDLEFEQLPFDHPICVNFTSGTSGLPKGPVHSAGTILPHLVDIVFSWNLKEGDTVYTCYPVGWTLWDIFVPCLALGVKLLLWCGAPDVDTPMGNLWDIVAKFKVTYVFLVTCIVDKLEKRGAVPAPSSNLENLKMLTMGGSSVKAQNYMYIFEKIKKDLFICSQYGATESFGTFSGFDINMPCYAGEIQAPALGKDIRCVDSHGNVVTERGEMVIASPSPSLPVYLWKDVDHTIMRATYLSQHPGFWCQSDEIWINPLTKGLVVIGRSDDTLKQNGERFGAADVYGVVHSMEEVEDYICVSQTRESDYDNRAVLFIKMRDGYVFNDDFKKKVEDKFETDLWVDCVPKLILETVDVPYNVNNKKMESIIRKIITTNKIPEAVTNIRNPDCLKHYLNIPEILSYQ